MLLNGKNNQFSSMFCKFRPLKKSNAAKLPRKAQKSVENGKAPVLSHDVIFVLLAASINGFKELNHGSLIAYKSAFMAQAKMRRSE